MCVTHGTVGPVHRSLFLASFTFTFVVALAGCGDAAPQTRPDPDTARECYPAGFDAGTDGDQRPGCAAGELCLEGRCYLACSSDSECGPRETCASSGACVAAPTGDAGIASDGGSSDVCALVECAGLQVCHPLSGTCVECNEATIDAEPDTPGHCPEGFACDIARGECAPVAAAQCAPCASDDDCVVADGFMGRCVTRTVQDVRERVCVIDCAGTECPGGLQCDTSNVCVPAIEIPCTTWLAGVRGRNCHSDAECAALGAVEALYENACEGAEVATTDGGTSTDGVCLRPCSEQGHCATDQECLGDPPFCRNPSP